MILSIFIRVASDFGEEDDLIPDWEKEIILVLRDINQNPENYIPIPDKFYINEYAIMKRFCLSIKNEKLREEMYSSIKGSGAFQRFKNNILHFNIANDWYKFKEDALREIAVEWCEENSIEYF